MQVMETPSPPTAPNGAVPPAESDYVPASRPTPAHAAEVPRAERLRVRDQARSMEVSGEPARLSEKHRGEQARSSEKHREERLRVANAVISLAHEHANELRHALAKLPPNATVPQREAAVRAWVGQLGRQPFDRVLLGLEASAASAAAAAAAAADVEASAERSPVLATWTHPPPSVEQLSKWQRRWALFAFECRRRKRHVLSELARRSEVFRRLFPQVPSTPRAPSEHPTSTPQVVHTLTTLRLLLDAPPVAP